VAEGMYECEPAEEIGAKGRPEALEASARGQ